MVSRKSAVAFMVLGLFVLLSSGADCQEKKANPDGLLAVSPEDLICKADADCAVINLDCTSCHGALSVVNASAIISYTKVCAEFYKKTRGDKACDEVFPMPNFGCRKGRCIVISTLGAGS